MLHVVSAKPYHVRWLSRDETAVTLWKPQAGATVPSSGRHQPSLAPPKTGGDRAPWRAKAVTIGDESLQVRANDRSLD